ncbi:unnamed protein product [Auanema sp. JU1783]|nr:unnamed protein product [Auanema sp. JU1783]
MLPTLDITPVDRWKTARKKCGQTKLPRIATIEWRQKLLNNVNKNKEDEKRNEAGTILFPELKLHEGTSMESKEEKEKETHHSHETKSTGWNSTLITDDYKKMNFAALSVEKIIKDQMEQVRQNIGLKKRNVNAIGDLMRKYNNEDAESSFEQLIEEYAKSCMELSSINCSLYTLRQDDSITNIAEVDVFKNEMEEILNEIQLEKSYIAELDRLLQSFNEKKL